MTSTVQANVLIMMTCKFKASATCLGRQTNKQKLSNLYPSLSADKTFHGLPKPKLLKGGPIFGLSWSSAYSNSHIELS